MKVVGKTHIGSIRKNNQDTLLLAKGIYGVADGMGGHNGGEVASSEAVVLLKKALIGKEPDIHWLEDAIIKVNHDLYLKQKDDESLMGMGTTLTVLWEQEDNLLLGHVGDSRVYLLRDGTFSKVTHDHSVVEEMIRQGILTKEKAKVHPYRNVVTRAVGSGETIEVDTMVLERKDKDVWLICSDGLTSMVDDEEIEKVLKGHAIERSLEILMELALQNGGRDNISIVLLEDREVGK